MVLQVLPPEGLDVGVDAADLGALRLLQLSLQLLPVCVLHGFDGCRGWHRVSTRHRSAQRRLLERVFFLFSVWFLKEQDPQSAQ